jgi:glycosyltransferase involved in cell wall biosynthesis
MQLGLRVNKPPALTYIIGTYPGLTTTFIDREVTLLRKMGVQLRIVSIRKPWTQLSPQQEALRTGVRYLLPVDRQGLLNSQIHFLFRRPGRYFGTLIYLLTRPHPSLKARGKTFLHFVEGVYAAYLLRREPGEHLHAHFIDRAATVALVASRLLNVPYSVTAHASDIYVSPVLLPEKLAGAKFVATCTGYNRDYLAKRGQNLFDHKLLCIYHGLETDRYQRTQFSNPARPIILSVGQLMERKGFPYLIEACKILRDRGVDFECRIIGDGPIRAALQAQIHQLGLEDRVTLCGSVSHQQVITEYEQATLFTLPAILGSDGDRDGIPNVILEALAMELPVVSTDHSGIPEVVEDGVNGLLVPQANAQALAAAVERLLSDPQMRQTFGRAGRQIVSERFDPQKNIHRLLEAFSA